MGILRKKIRTIYKLLTLFCSCRDSNVMTLLIGKRNFSGWQYTSILLYFIYAWMNLNQIYIVVFLVFYSFCKYKNVYISRFCSLQYHGVVENRVSCTVRCTIVATAMENLATCVIEEWKKRWANGFSFL